MPAVAEALPGGMKILERLVHEARIDANDYQRALLHAQRGGERIEDAIVETGVMSEADLLRYLASIYRTRFVSTERLARAGVSATALRIVPYKLAERLLACPLMHDVRTQALTVVAADLEETDVERQLLVVTGVREVKVLVARPSAVRALLRKAYLNDQAAFAQVPQGAASRARQAQSFDQMLGTGGAYAETAAAAPAAARDHISLPPPTPPPPPREPVTRKRTNFEIEAPEIAAELARPLTSAGAGVSFADYLEMLHVMVALLERGREELRGHSGQVARLTRKVCERLGLTELQMHGILVAAYVHDIGKASAYHLTAFNVAQYEGHRAQAQKACLTPVRLLESAKLPETAVQALSHMYERYDGKGFPDHLAGKDIPLGARILAVVESYTDITSHEKNPYRKKLDPKEACTALARHGGDFFDPNLCQVLAELVLGDDLRSRLLEGRRTVLLVDPDPEETAVLDMRLVEHGHEVVIARAAVDAMERIERGGIDLIVTEVDLPFVDGFDMVMRLRGGPAKDVPIVFLTRRGDRDAVTRGFELGAADYVVKPASADVVAAKVRQVLDRKPQSTGGRGVTGSLSEMSLPDVVQVLANGRKSGQLTIRSGGQVGHVWFGDGQIHDARFGDVEAAPALYAMLALSDGEFTLDPTSTPTRRVIHDPTESLLLEGMRRMDEGHR